MNDTEKGKKILEITSFILRDIDEFCTKNNITYYLSGGSCLGAIRHHGFIPWDFDADIMMPRKEYERFIASFGSVYPEKYRMANLQTDEEWTRSFAKVWDRTTLLVERKTNEMPRGVAVDIFPIDGLPEGRLARKIHYRILKLLSNLRYCAKVKKGESFSNMKAFRTVVAPFARMIGAHRLGVMIENRARRYPFETSKYVGAVTACHYWERETLTRDCFDEAVRVPFEDMELPVPNGYDTYLSNLYGEYMKLPEDTNERLHKTLGLWDLQFDLPVDGQESK